MNERARFDSVEINQWLDRMSQELLTRLGTNHRSVKMLGIKTGGVLVAEQLHRKLALTTPAGALNISFYRDDFSRIGLHPQVGASDIPFSVDGEVIILVDDVLYSGRTIRAAMNEIFDYGRPDRILLATLIERAGRELPICADVIGHRMELAPHQNIKLQEDLSLEIEER
ncbi:bifunctional pyr operon transcriptional regulator/uracil phosphoribosyltransferase [Chromatiales bacterium (ex Bugula neritina AB1)]|nr:bifunctional pyr operon transcriptional regulator/uracil phosphoribosyltransferase [Chromatiales bacterium (ex Bugula neritina AB1)]